MCSLLVGEVETKRRFVCVLDIITITYHFHCHLTWTVFRMTVDWCVLERGFFTVRSSKYKCSNYILLHC